MEELFACWRCICRGHCSGLLHSIQVSLQHLFKSLDGATSEPVCILGPIGRALATREKLHIKQFHSISCDLSYLNLQELSIDQRSVNEICDAVAKAKSSIDLPFEIQVF